MLAAALAPHGGIVMWRAFVYKDDGTDRIGQAYTEFKPLDGKFNSGTMVQVKNGPLDFQPREPFHPLFGAMTKTPLALEVQITKEYLGEDTHLVYLGPLWQEVLQSDTYAKGQGSLVARVVDGSLTSAPISAMAGVANIGSDTNWMGSHFNQANWYAFGRLAWNPDLSAQDIADEWIRQTFSNDPVVVAPVTQMMMNSRQNCVNYMEPLGLVHMMGSSHHYGPAPWVSDQTPGQREPDLLRKGGRQRDRLRPHVDRQQHRRAVRVAGGQHVRHAQHDAGRLPAVLPAREVGRQAPLVGAIDLGRAGLPLQPGRRCRADDEGSVGDGEGARRQQAIQRRHRFLQTQHYEARWWRDACLTYFASLNKKAIPTGYSPPQQSLSYLPGPHLPQRRDQAALPRHLHRQPVARHLP